MARCRSKRMRSTRGLGQIQRRAGRPEQAHEHLATAATLYREMAMSHWLEPAPAAGV